MDMKKGICLIGLIINLSFFFVSCVGEFKYTPPTLPIISQNSIVVSKSKDELWEKGIPELSKTFFVINNLDKDSGLINISYSGNPEEYIDCGRIYSYVKNAMSERTYSFPAAKARQIYEIMDMEHGGILSSYDRKMELEGRINIVIEALSSSLCQITVNTRYVLTRSIRGKNAQGNYGYVSDSISFNSGQKDKFPGIDESTGTYCQPTGKLEQTILSIFSQFN